MTDTRLITALQDPARYDHPVSGISVTETHISWVILTGDYVYKIKKPVNLGFLDFSSLTSRRHYCEAELVLNRRLAPELYLDVVALTGSADDPRINGAGEAFEYAVRMRQFDPEQQFDRLLQRGELSGAHIDALADTVAAFHLRIERADATLPYGRPAAVWQPMQENFDQIGARLTDARQQARLAQLRHWSARHFETLQPVIAARQRDGFVRNCHGDMHLANITLFGGRVTVFDCIEFNDNFRWIDVISEIAFTTMDLAERGRPDLAARLLDRYLQRSGDYAGLALLRYYQVYRALVRAKVAIIRHGQSGLPQADVDRSWREFTDYIGLAQHFTRPRPPVLCITHGVSGSGKTTLSQPLVEGLGIIRLRSDVERKRMFGLTAEAASASNTGTGIYTRSASEHTYRRLAELAASVVRAGYSVIVDATFLKREQRSMFRAVAREVGVPFVILHFYAAEALLRQWIGERLSAGKDASEATLEVLDQQLNTAEALTPGEAGQLIAVDSGRDDAAATLLAAVQAILPPLNPPRQDG